MTPLGCICPPLSERSCRNPICGRANPNAPKPPHAILDKAVEALRLGLAFAESEADARGGCDKDYDIKAQPTVATLSEALTELEAFAARSAS